MGASKRYQHAERVWCAMYDRAVPLDQLTGKDRYLRGMVPTGTMGVFVGSLMEVCRDLGWASSGKYDQLKRLLVAMGTIAMLRRGSAHRESAWALLQRPTEALFAEHVRSPGGPRQLAPIPATGVVDPNGLAAFLALSPAGRTEALRDMASKAAYLAVKALVEEVQTSANSQARTAAARSLLALGRDTGGLEPDPLAHFAEQWGSELAEQVHATPAPIQ